MTLIQFGIGLLATLSALLLWFESPLKITLGKIIFNQTLKFNEEFDDILFMKVPLLSELSGCWICCSFWFSLAIGTLLTLCLGLEPWVPVLTFCCYPSIAYLYKKLIK
ncbi:MAG: hypothetical protein EB127_01465 [Alphaproteobacteria bacterium]|nr:hypothetical protein [Alphaproteobacteria bacterium]